MYDNAEPKRVKFVNIQKGVGFEMKDGDKLIHFNHLAGFLTGIREGSYEYEGEEKHKIYLNIIDNQINEQYEMSVGFGTYYGLSLLNSLASLKPENLGWLDFYFKQKGKNINIEVQHGGFRLGWKYSSEELTQAQVYGPEADADAMEEYTAKLLKEIEKIIAAKGTGTYQADPDAWTPDEYEQQSVGGDRRMGNGNQGMGTREQRTEEDDDVPFGDEPNNSF